MKSAFTRRAGCVGLMLSLAGCTDATAPVSGPDPVVSAAWVTGPALAALGPDGRFTLDTPALPLVSRARADTFAMATADFLREVFGDVASEDVLAGRGGPVHLRELIPCLRRIYSSTALDYSSLVGGASRERFSASNWLVSMCNASGTAELVVSVTDVRTALVVANGRFVAPWFNSGDFSFFPLPIATAQYGLYLSPEAAVEFVARLSGVRIHDIPVANISWSPNGTTAGHEAAQCITWRITTETLVLVRTSTGRTVTTSEFFVKRELPCGGGMVTAFVPAAMQPSALWKTVFPLSDTSTVRDSVLIPTLAPVLFERVTSWTSP